MTDSVINRAAALLLVGSLVVSAAQAKVPPNHGKKAAHKTAAKKATASDAETSVAWKADAKLLSQLQPERQFGAFSMRIPTGFTVEQHEQPTAKAQITMYLVKGPTRPDGTFLAIFVGVGTAAPGYETGSVDALLNSNAVINSQADLTRSDVQDGEVSGLEISRQYYKYRAAPGSSAWIHGLQYATTDGHTDAVVAAMDAEPYHSKSLPLAEAAALTLHRTP